jgi:hypothetical protein
LGVTLSGCLYKPLLSGNFQYPFSDGWQLVEREELVEVRRLGLAERNKEEA